MCVHGVNVFVWGVCVFGVANVCVGCICGEGVSHVE